RPAGAALRRAGAAYSLQLKSSPRQPRSWPSVNRLACDCQGEDMGSRLLHRSPSQSPRSRPPAGPHIERAKETRVQDAAAIAARLRALIPSSTDPARLEKMAREIESRSTRH